MLKYPCKTVLEFARVFLYIFAYRKGRAEPVL